MAMQEKMEDLEFLRGIAVLFVVIHHIQNDLVFWNPPQMMAFYQYFGGSVGVDLFFVISGFIIAKIYLAGFQVTDRQTAGSNFILFWYRRAIRLLPAAWFWLALSVVLNLTFNLSGAFGTLQATVDGALAAVLNIANMRFMDCFTVYECGPNAIHWTLSLEQQFYFVFPFVAFLLGRRLVPVLAVVLFAQFFSETLSTWYGFRITGFCLGICLAVMTTTWVHAALEPTPLLRSRVLQWVVPLLLIALLGNILSTATRMAPPGVRFDIAALVGAMLVFLASYDKGYLLPKSPLKSLVVWVGSRSYSVYLCHILCYLATREIYFRVAPELARTTEGAYAYLATGLVLTFVCSELSYRFIEVRFKEAGSRKIAAIKARLPLRHA